MNADDYISAFCLCSGEFLKREPKSYPGRPLYTPVTGFDQFSMQLIFFSARQRFPVSVDIKGFLIPS